LVLAVGGNALDIDTQYLETVSEDLHNYFSSHLKALLHEHARPQQISPVVVLKNADTCKPCVQEVSKYLIEETVGKMKKMCEKASNGPHGCVAGKICGMMAKHPKVTLGMMMEHVRPVSMGMAYCTGKGACKKPDEVTMAEIAMGEQPHEALLQNFDEVDWTDIEEHTEELEVTQGNDGQMEASQMCMQEKPQHHKVCPHCMKHAMRYVMGHAIKKVKMMCMKSKCPVMQKMCPWMKQNKEVALGMLIAKVEPWKMAFGYCVHKKRSHQGPAHKMMHFARHAWKWFHSKSGQHVPEIAV